MKQFDIIDLRREWTQLSTVELEKLLASELENRPPDDEIVLTLLHILEEREAHLPLRLSPREAEAWEQYKQKTRNRKRQNKYPRRWLSIAATFVLIITIVFSVVPQQAEAETFWEMLQRWSDTVLEFFSGEGKLVDIDYCFETDNPGLQQVYDAVLELGVTEPVVPMWLPDGFLLNEIDMYKSPMSNGVYTSFSNGDDEIVYKLDVYSGEPAHQFYKDDTHYESHEWDGTTYNIARNNDRWLVVWGKENIECSIALDCQEETLRRILRSIYVTEVS